MDLANQKNIFVVLGVARSGTSVIIKALNALGIDLGNNFIAANEWNPKGFREDADIVHNVNQKIFDRLHYTLNTLSLFERDLLLNDKLSDIRDYAINLLNQRLASVSSWGFKDPRTVRVLAFWQSIFSTLNLRENYVITLRNPLSSAHSYHSSLSGYHVEKKLLLWLLHLLPAIDDTQGKNRIVVNYDLMLQDPQAQLQRLHHQLNLSTVFNQDEVHAFAEEFLDPALRHSDYTYDDLKSHSAITIVPLCLKVYDLLSKLSRDEIRDTDSLFLSAWQEIKAEFAHIYPLFPYIDKLLEKNYGYEKSLHKMKKSFWWKIGAPLRRMRPGLLQE